MQSTTRRAYNRLGTILRWTAWTAAVLFILFPEHHIQNAAKSLLYALVAIGFLYLIASEFVLPKVFAGFYRLIRAPLDILTDIGGGGIFVWATGGHESPLVLFYYVFLARSAFVYEAKSAWLRTTLVALAICMSFGSKSVLFGYARHEFSFHFIHVMVIVISMIATTWLCIRISGMLNALVRDGIKLLGQKDGDVKKIVGLNRIGGVISSNIELDKIYLGLITELNRILPFDRLTISLLDESKENVEMFAATSEGEIVSNDAVRPARVCCAARTIKEQGPVLHHDLSKKPHLPDDRDVLSDGMNSCVSIPLMSRERLTGALCLFKQQKNGFSKKDLEILRPVAYQVAMAVENAHLYQRLKERAVRDSLTGIYNYAYLHAFLTRELARARRYKRPLSVVMLDIDDFKRYNDTHGHQNGDKVLKSFAKTLQANTRLVDIAARYGSDEFVLVLPDTDHTKAASIVERMREGLEREKFFNEPDGGPLSFSFGITSYPSEAEDENELIRIADRKLYKAKKVRQRVRPSAVS